MESSANFHVLKAALDWQVDLGVSDAICDEPIDRFALENVKPSAPKPKTKVEPVVPIEIEIDAAKIATEMAAKSNTIEELRAAVTSFDLCDLKRGSRNTVFSDGTIGADIMVIGEAPGRDEDIAGKPFVGRAGQLLDRMFAAIGRDRSSEDPQSGLYITNVMPWRPPQNRDPEPDEIAMMVPFLNKHIELARPKAVVLMGNVSCLALLGRKGITRMRGTWETVGDIAALPMFHPAYLLRNPAAKREAWADLLALSAKVEADT